MKLIFFLAIVALGSATTLYGEQKDIRVNDNHIVVHVPGKLVIFERSNEDGRGVQIVVKEHNRFIKKIVIDRNNHIVKEISFSVHHELPDHFSEEDQSKEMRTIPLEGYADRTRRSECSNIHGDKMTCLVTIFKKYEGTIGENTFKKLLDDIKLAVDENDFHPVILEVLKDLEEQTSVHEQVHSFWPFHWHTKDEGRTKNLRTFEDIHEDSREDQHKNKELFGTTEMFGTDQEHQHHLNLEHLVSGHNEWVQQDLEKHEKQIEDTIRNMDKSTRRIDCSKDSMTKQLVFQNNIRELQGHISHHQLTVQQLQLQQQFLNQQKHHTKLQILAGHHQGLSSTQMQELHRVRDQLQKREHELLEIQKNINTVIHKLHEQLTKQVERQQKCLEEESKEDERTMMQIH